MDYKFIWYALSSINGFGLKKLNTIYNAIIKKSLNFSEIIQLTPEEFSQDFDIDLKNSSLAVYSLRSEKIKKSYEKLLKSKVEFILPECEKYPSKVKNFYNHPPALFAYGDTSILNTNSIGISGSRDASDNGIKNAYSLAKKAIERDLTVVSGFARGIDEAAHCGAISNNGKTILVLPTGIFNYWRSKSFLKNMDNSCVISMFHPNISFSKWTAVERNHLIAAFSDIIFIVEAKMPSGSLMQGKISIKFGLPTFVFDSKLKGNYYLLKNGAMPVNADKIETVFNSLEFLLPRIDFKNKKYEVTEIWEAKAV